MPRRQTRGGTPGRFDKYLVIMPCEVKVDILGNGNSAASGRLEVKGGDVAMVWRDYLK